MLNKELMEEILSSDNLHAAYGVEKRNRGVAGADGVGVEQLAAHLRKHWEGIEAKRSCARGAIVLIPCGAWKIPKAKGNTAHLTISTLYCKPL